MKLKHKVPSFAVRSATVTPEYQAEVDRSTNKAMAAYERAQRRLNAAKRRLEKAQQRSAERLNVTRRRAADRELKVAAELVELRREELQRLESLMRSAPASAEHRGVHAFRPVPQPGGSF